MSKQQMVKVANPAPNDPTYVTLSTAKRFKRFGWARHDCGGKLVMLVDLQTMIRRTEIAKRSNVPPSCALTEVTVYSGCDARPFMPVLPPSPEVLARMGSSKGRPVRGPLRPPMKRKNTTTVEACA